MTYYTVFHNCGYKLCKDGNGTNIEIHYLKCNGKMTIEIKDEKVDIQGFSQFRRLQGRTA